jgi:hypothetical protein
MVRLPKELLCTERAFPIYLFSFCVCLFILILKIYLYIFTRSKEVSANTWTQKIKDNLELDYYYNYYSVKSQKCHEYLIDKLDFMDNILNFLIKLSLKNYLNLQIMYFGLTYGPRYVVSLIFFFESVFYHKLSLFYSCLPLLFLPLLCQYMLFAVKNFLENNLEYLNNILDVEVFLSETTSKVSAKAYHDYILSLEPNAPYKALMKFKDQAQIYLKNQNRDVLEETKSVIDLFYSIVNVNIVWVDLNKLKLTYNIYFQLGSIIIYLISWVYIILYTGEGSTELLKSLNLILILASKEEPFSGVLID